MISYRELVHGFRELNLTPEHPVLVHSAISTFGDEIRGGTETILGALLTSSPRLMAPVFTYKTMIIPEEGPEENASLYGSGKDTNLMAEFFTPDMPADPLMGALPETLRQHPGSRRSGHPVLSFAAVGLDEAIAAQTLADPFAPIRALAEMSADVLLIGVDHTSNTSIHYAEALAGRKQFTRWALTPAGIVQFEHFPGCSDGFNAAAPYLSEITRRTQIGQAEVRAISLAALTATITALLKEQPQALLCSRPRGACLRCDAVREHLAAS